MDKQDNKDIKEIESNLNNASFYLYGRELCSIVLGFSSSAAYEYISYLDLGRLACATIEQRKRALINLGWLL